MTTTLMKASHQWATRPSDERFTSLDGMLAHFRKVRQESTEATVASRRIFAQPDEDNQGLTLTGFANTSRSYDPTHWSFGQIAQLAEAPAGYLRTLPAPIAADAINWGLQYKRHIQDVGLLLRSNGADTVQAATGPNYGRVWNEEIISMLLDRFGNGRDGAWRVPGEFGKRVEVTKENTTLFASDRDLFVFLADEENRIEIPNRRAGMYGGFARGFFTWNSEVGSKTLGGAFFLYDYTCCNRIVWGVEDYQEISIRHTASAPDKWLDEVTPVIESYAKSSTATVTQAIENARAKKVEKVDEFLAARFGKRLVQPIKATFQAEEDRPIETLWDVTTGVTAYARGIQYQDDRVTLERAAGDILKAAA